MISAATGGARFGGRRVARGEDLGVRDVQDLDGDGEVGFEGGEDGQFWGDTKIVVGREWR